MSNGQAWEIRKEIESVIYYLKCKIFNEKEIYIGKQLETIRRNLKIE